MIKWIREYFRKLVEKIETKNKPPKYLGGHKD